MTNTPINVPLSDWQRHSAKEADLRVKNRFFESNPVLNENGVSAIARPGLKYWASIGDGPIRGIFQQPGTFDDDAFAVSYDTVYRLDRQDLGNTAIFTGLAGGDTTINMAATGDIGSIPP